MATLANYFTTNPELYYLAYLAATLFGLCIGSFINVVIYRLPQMLHHEWYNQCLGFLNDQLQAKPKELRKQCPACAHQHNQPLTLTSCSVSTITLSSPNSSCPRCAQEIKWRDNIPVLSYLWLRGRCRYCAGGISIRYPLIEAGCGLLAPLLLWHFGLSAAFAGSLLLSYAMVALVMIDYDIQILPDDITLPLLWIGLLFNINAVYAPLADAVIGAVSGYLLLWLVYQAFKKLTGKEGMGYGDFKLLAVFGAWLGWQMLPLIILIASLVGSVVGLGLMLRHKQSLPFAFGPFLALGGMISFLYGLEIMQWYLGMF